MLFFFQYLAYFTQHNVPRFTHVLTMAAFHPVYGSIYTGSVISMDSNGFVVSPDKSVELNTGDYLSDMALKTGDMIRSIKAEITQIKDNLLEMSFR